MATTHLEKPSVHIRKSHRTRPQGEGWAWYVRRWVGGGSARLSGAGERVGAGEEHLRSEVMSELDTCPVALEIPVDIRLPC